MRRILLAVILASAVPLPDGSASAGLLGSTDQVRNGTEATGRWSAMLARVGRVADPCAAPTPAALLLAEVRPGGSPAAAPDVRAPAPICRTDEGITELRAAARQTATLPLIERIRSVNAAVNRQPYVADRANYGAEDYWATPDEFAARGGDCEDYAIAKYMLLKEAGVPPEAMRVAIVYDLALNASHAVLGVTVGGTEYILDNQVEDVLPDTQVDYYQPVYSVNEHGWWLHMLA